MGRPKMVCPSTVNERVNKYRLDINKKAAAQERQKKARRKRQQLSLKKKKRNGEMQQDCAKHCHAKISHIRKSWGFNLLTETEKGKQTKLVVNVLRLQKG